MREERFISRYLFEYTCNLHHYCDLLDFDDLIKFSKSVCYTPVTTDSIVSVAEKILEYTSSDYRKSLTLVCSDLSYAVVSVFYETL